MRAIFATVFVISMAWFASGQAPASTHVAGIEDIFLARDDGKGKAGEQVEEFVTSDVPIYCVVVLDTAEAVAVKMNFVAVKVAGVKAETKVVTASYTTKAGQDRVNFTGRPYDAWVPGRYRVDIFINGKSARGLEFDIKMPLDRSLGGKPAAASDAAARPVKAARKP